MVSKDGPSQKLGGFSMITHKGVRDGEIRLLVGPIRFANHNCRPNCEVRITIGALVVTHHLILIFSALEYH